MFECGAAANRASIVPQNSETLADFFRSTPSRQTLAPTDAGIKTNRFRVLFFDTPSGVGHVNSDSRHRSLLIDSRSGYRLLHSLTWLDELPMIKKMTFAVVALLGFASQGFARHPFDNDPIANTPSVLVKAQAPVDAAAPTAEVAAEVGADAVAAQPQVDAAAHGAAPVQGEAVVVEGDAAPAAQSEVIYHTVRPARRSSKGIVGELIDLERRKNAWIRKNIFGR
jgi:hypothetical protein